MFLSHPTHLGAREGKISSFPLLVQMHAQGREGEREGAKRERGEDRNPLLLSLTCACALKREGREGNFLPLTVACTHMRGNDREEAHVTGEEKRIRNKGNEKEKRGKKEIKESSPPSGSTHAPIGEQGKRGKEVERGRRRGKDTSALMHACALTKESEVQRELGGRWIMRDRKISVARMRGSGKGHGRVEESGREGRKKENEEREDVA